MPRKEESYYEEISQYLSQTIADQLKGYGDFSVCFKPLGTTDLKRELLGIIREMEIDDPNLRLRAELCTGLRVDVAGVVYSLSSCRSVLIIVEVKTRSLTLTDLSQLAGYCIYSWAEYGILIGAKCRLTKGFQAMLTRRPEVLNITSQKGRERQDHQFALCSWYPKSHSPLRFGGFHNQPRDIASLCRMIAARTSAGGRKGI